MARRRFALERGGPKRLELRWRRGLRDFQVALDGQVWSLDRTAVVAGTSLTLPGGSSLFVQWVKRRWSSIALRDTLRVDKDGVPLPGSDEDPRVVGRRAASLIALFGLLRVFFLALFFSLSRPGGGSSPVVTLAAGSAFFIAVEGALLVALALAAAFGVRAAVVAAAAVLALEFLAYAALGALKPSLGTVVQVLVIVHLWQAWKRMKPKVPTASLAAVFE